MNFAISLSFLRKRPFLAHLFLRGSTAICSHQQIFRWRTRCRQFASGMARLFGGRTTRLGFKVSSISVSIHPLPAQPVDATLYLKGEMEWAWMGQRFHRGFGDPDIPRS